MFDKIVVYLARVLLKKTFFKISFTMDVAIRFCCIAASLSTLVFSAQLKWRRNKAFDDVLPVNINMTSKVPARSLLTCATRCSEQRWCNTFFYNDISKECLRQRMVYEFPVGVTSAAGWRYFKLISGGSQYFSDRLSGFHYRLDRNVTIEGGWFQGRQNCVGHGEDLVVLEPVLKADFISDFFRTNSGGLKLVKDIHIGAKRPDPSQPFPTGGPDYLWVDGQVLNMTATSRFWFPGAPLFISFKGALRLYLIGNFTWKEATHTWGKRYSLCEKPFVVDYD